MPKLDVDIKINDKSVTKLLDVVSKGIGVAYEPTRIRRRARAESAAAIEAEKNKGEIRLLKLENDEKVKERKALLKRASQRVAYTEERREQNIEAVVKEGLKSLPNEVSDKPVDPDWINRFFDDCKDISNEDIRVVLGKLLAGEVTHPNTFSRRTIGVIKELSARELRTFQVAVSIAWIDSSSRKATIFLPPIGSPDPLAGFGLAVEDLISLDAAGLVHSTSILDLDVRHNDVFSFGSTKYRMETRARMRNIPFTREGTELLALVEPTMPHEVSEEYLRLLLHWSTMNGLSVSSVLPPTYYTPGDSTP